MRRSILSFVSLFLTVVLSLAGCDADASTHRVGDAYERNNMPSADPDRPAGPHSLPDDSQGDRQMLHPSP